jgi:hypothetical protein
MSKKDLIKKEILTAKAGGFKTRGFAAGQSNRSQRFAGRIKATREFGNLGQLEEKADISFFIKIGKSAAHNAINENKAMGIAITYLDGNSVVKKQPDGAIQVKRQLTPVAHRKFAKGTVLNVATKKRS